MLEAVLEGGFPPQDKERGAIFTIRRTLEMYEEVWRNLEWRRKDISGRPNTGTNQLQQISGAFEDWKAHELNDRVLGLATTLVSSGHSGERVAILGLRNLFVPSGDPRNQENRILTTQLFRVSLVERLLEKKKPSGELLREMLGDSDSPGAVLSAARMLLEVKDVGRDELVEMAESVLNTYQRWIRSEGFWCQFPLQADDFELAWCVAGVVSLTTDARERMAELIAGSEIPAEGWNHDFTKFLNSERPLSHLYTVGAMASEWLYIRKDLDSASQTFEFIWRSFHTWLRGLGSFRGLDQEVSSALVQLWARLQLIYGEGASTVAEEAIKELDQIEWVLLAGESLFANLKGSTELEMHLQRTIRTRFEEDLPALRKSRRFDPPTLTQLTNRITALTPHGGYPH